MNNSTSHAFFSWADGKGMKLAQSFIARLKNKDDSFVNLSIKSVAAETFAYHDEDASRIRKSEVMIHIQLRKPCAHAEAERHFKKLIEDMELAGFSPRFSSKELYRSDIDTTDYLLSFVKRDTIEL